MFETLDQVDWGQLQDAYGPAGATPARINLLRRKDNLAGKKLVIWCFSAREFTEAAGGWRLVPVIGKK